MATQAGFRWTLSLGHWRGASVEIHLLLLLGLVVTMAANADQPVAGAVIATVWFVSVALHQLAHVAVARRVGGTVTRVVIGPAGGTYEADIPDEPEPQVLVALFGPALHLLLVVAAMCPLVLERANEVLALLHPIAASGEIVSTAPIGLAALKATIWINWLLFLVNLLPAYPFDTAVVLRSLLWPMVGRRTAHVTTGRLAQAAAVGFLFCGLYLATMVETEAYIWAIPLCAALYLIVASQRDWYLLGQTEKDFDEEEWLHLDADELDNEVWLRDDSNHMVLVEQHYDQLRERYERKRKAQEDYEDARVDDILARLHNEGFEHLSQDDQAFLRRASRRYRDRRRDRDLPGE